MAITQTELDLLYILALRAGMKTDLEEVLVIQSILRPHIDIQQINKYLNK
jgi:hypothetical protein